MIELNQHIFSHDRKFLKGVLLTYNLIKYSNLQATQLWKLSIRRLVPFEQFLLHLRVLLVSEKQLGVGGISFRNRVRR